jgi:hypothetical protein
MAKSLGQLEVLSVNIKELAGEEAFAQVMQGYEVLTEKSKPVQVTDWVKGTVQRLDETVDPYTAEQIMLRCGYNCAMTNQGPIAAAKKRRAKYASLDEFLAAEQNSPPAGMRFERNGNVVFQYYTPRAFSQPMRCYCGLMRALPKNETVSKTFCNCSRGFVQVWWEGILGCPVVVEILETAISGAEECKFSIRLD